MGMNDIPYSALKWRWENRFKSSPWFFDNVYGRSMQCSGVSWVLMQISLSVFDFIGKRNFSK
jgi:hypothetical protein